MDVHPKTERDDNALPTVEPYLLVIDEYVTRNKRADEAPEQAYSRLARGDRTFAEL